MPIKIIPSPRPEPGQEPPLPTYHELLNHLCDEFSVPGSHDFRGAIRYIKEHYPSITLKFLEWCQLEGHGSNENAMRLIETYSRTPEGRQQIAQAYITPAQQRLHRALRGHSEARQLALTIETLINSFPAVERFSPPLITLREVLIDLYGFLSPNYEPVPENDGEITYERIQQVAQEAEAYTGPRPTRFEHIFEEDEDP
jgi:hypothetical protein